MQTVPEWRGAGEPNSEIGGHRGPEVAGARQAHSRGQSVLAPGSVSGSLSGTLLGQAGHPSSCPSAVDRPPPGLALFPALHPPPRALEESGASTAGGALLVTHRLAPQRQVSHARLSILPCSRAGPKPQVMPVSNTKGHGPHLRQSLSTRRFDTGASNQPCQNVKYGALPCSIFKSHFGSCEITVCQGGPGVSLAGAALARGSAACPLRSQNAAHCSRVKSSL